MKKRCRWQTSIATLFAGNAERSESNDLLEELLALGVTGAEYDAWLIALAMAINSPAALSK